MKIAINNSDTKPITRGQKDKVSKMYLFFLAHHRLPSINECVIEFGFCQQNWSRAYMELIKANWIHISADRTSKGFTPAAMAKIQKAIKK